MKKIKKKKKKGEVKKQLKIHNRLQDIDIAQ